MAQRKVILVEEEERPWIKYVLDQVQGWGHEVERVDALSGDAAALDKEAVYLMHADQYPGETFREIKRVSNAGARVVAIVHRNDSYIHALSSGARDYFSSAAMDLSPLKKYLDREEGDVVLPAGSVP